MFRINQYQDIFFIDDKLIKVDYLKGKLDIQKVICREEISFVNSKKCSELENKCFSLFKTGDETIVTIVLIPTYECNMNCIYCYESTIKRKRKTLDVSVSKAIISYIIENKIEKVNFIFLGGEPIQSCNIIFSKIFLMILQIVVLQILQYLVFLMDWKYLNI